MVEFLGKVVLLLGWMLVLAEADVAHLRGVNPASGRSLNPGPNVNFYTEPVAFGTFSGYPAYAGPKLTVDSQRLATPSVSLSAVKAPIIASSIHAAPAQQTIESIVASKLSAVFPTHYLPASARMVVSSFSPSLHAMAHAINVARPTNTLTAPITGPAITPTVIPASSTAAPSLTRMPNADIGLSPPDVDASLYARINQQGSIAFPSLSSNGYVYDRDLVPTTAQPPIQLTPVSYPITDSFPPYAPSDAQTANRLHLTRTEPLPSFVPQVKQPATSYTGYSYPGTQHQVNRQHFEPAKPAVVVARLATGAAAAPIQTAPAQRTSGSQQHGHAIEDHFRNGVIHSTGQHREAAATYNEAVGYEYKVPTKRF